MIDRRAFVLGSGALAASCMGHPQESRRARADDIDAKQVPDESLALAK